MKITPQMEAMYSTLVSLAPCAVERSRPTDDYLALLVSVGKKRRRIAVTIYAENTQYVEGTSFSTKDKQLLEHLEAEGVHSIKHPSSEPKFEFSYIFPGLTPEMVGNHPEHFRKLIEQSIDLKQHRA